MAAALLAESTAIEMRRVQFPALDETQGLLWYYDVGDTLIGHDGGDPGTSAFIFFDPETRDGVLLVANGDWYADDEDAPLAYALISKLFEEASLMNPSPKAM